MRLKYILYIYFCVFISFLPNLKAQNENDANEIIIQRLEKKIDDVKYAGLKIQQILDGCNSIFVALIEKDAIKASDIDFLDTDLEPFGFSILLSMKRDLAELRFEQKSAISTKDKELEECKNMQNNKSIAPAEITKTEKPIEQETTTTTTTKAPETNINKPIETPTDKNTQNSTLVDTEDTTPAPKNVDKPVEPIEPTKPKEDLKPVSESCTDIVKNGHGAGVHTISTVAGEIEVYCDHFGRMLIQHQSEGPLDFDRNWSEYKNGFGNLESQYWFGLEKLYQLTSKQHYELFYFLKDFDDNVTYSHYNHFIIGSEAEEYIIKQVGEYSGTTEIDMFTYHVNMKFSTKDHDNDNGKNYNCAEKHKSGWWYHYCYYINLNEMVGAKDSYIDPTYSYILRWYNKIPLKEVSMYIKLHK